MERQTSNLMKRRQIYTSSQNKHKINDNQDLLNKTLKKNKFDDQHFQRQSCDHESKVNLPKLTSNYYKTTNTIFDARNQEFRKPKLQINEQINKDSLTKYYNEAHYNTIFSNNLKIDYKPKIDQIYADKTQKKQKSSHSKSSKSSSMSKIDLKQLKRKGFKKIHYLNVKGQKIEAIQKNNQLQECLTNKKIHKHNFPQNQLSAKDIILNTHFQNRKLGNFQNIQPNKSKQTKNFIKQKQKDKRNLTRVQSGLQLIRQNKLNRAKKLINQRELRKATQVLNLLLQIDENDIQVMYILAQISEDQSKMELSKKYLKLIVLNEANSYKFDQQILKVKSLIKLQKYEEALQKIQLIEQKSKSFANQQKFELLKIKGELNIKTGFHEDALQCFQMALQISGSQYSIHPTYQIFHHIGNIYMHFNMYKKSLNYFQKSKHNLDQTQKTQKTQKILKQINQKICYCLQNIKLKSNKKNMNFQQSKPYSAYPMKKVSNQFVSNLSRIQEFDKKLQSQDYLSAYKILITDQNGQRQQISQLLSEIKNQKITDLAMSLKQKGFYQEALNVFNLQKDQNMSFFGIEQCAKLHYKLGDFDKCYQQFQKYISLSIQLNDSIRKEQKSEIQMKKSDYQQRNIEIAQNLNSYMLKIKQLEMLSMTESDFQEITKRRNYNIGQAIKIFENFSIQSSLNDSNKIKALSVIGEESTISIMKNQQMMRNQKLVYDVFTLKQLRQVLSIWKDNKFSIQSIKKIAQITYSLVKTDKNDFSLLPLHIIAYTMKMNKLKIPFIKINQNINKEMSHLSKLYPPSQKSITQSELKHFEINWNNKQKIDLFKKQYLPQDFKQIYKRMEELSINAFEQKPLMDEKCKQICDRFNGFSYKSNLKLPVIFDDQNKTKNQRNYCRIIEKILSNDLQKKKFQFLASIKLENNTKLNEVFLILNQKWEQTINDILKVKKQNKIHTPCYVYDLMRAKCMFSSIKDIDSAAETFILGDKNGQYKVIEIDNRLNNKTKDVVLKIQFKNIVGELQLALEFESQKNEFNHSLYELSRSPFGPFFASFMWFTGFINKEENSKLIVNQKLKWKMKKLEHLRKFIYENNLIIETKEIFEKLCIKKQFKCSYLVLTDFIVNSNSIQGILMTSQGKYVQIQSQYSKGQSSKISVKSLQVSNFSISSQNKNKFFQLSLGDTRPDYKFRFLFQNNKQSFASQQKFRLIKINLVGTHYFLSLVIDKQKEGKIVLIQRGIQQMMNIQIKEQDNSDYIDKKVQKQIFEISFRGQSSLQIKQNISQNKQLFERKYNYKIYDYNDKVQQAQRLQKQISELIRYYFYQY